MKAQNLKAVINNLKMFIIWPFLGFKRNCFGDRRTMWYITDSRYTIHAMRLVFICRSVETRDELTAAAESLGPWNQRTWFGRSDGEPTMPVWLLFSVALPQSSEFVMELRLIKDETKDCGH